LELETERPSWLWIVKCPRVFLCDKSLIFLLDKSRAHVDIYVPWELHQSSPTTSFLRANTDICTKKWVYMLSENRPPTPCRCVNARSLERPLLPPPVVLGHPPAMLSDVPGMSSSDRVGRATAGRPVEFAHRPCTAVTSHRICCCLSR
jgi:hypothetical protein